MKKVLRILIPLILIAGIAGGAAYYKYSTRTRWNDSFVNATRLATCTTTACSANTTAPFISATQMITTTSIP